jgi:uncharacterized Zn finger protein
MKRKNFLVPKKEEFVCLNCGQKVAGGRYVNHCPQCLWSQHVDDQIPGDRQSNCRGPMEPIGVIRKGEGWRIIHRCQRCGKKTVVDTNKEDNFDLIIKLAQDGLTETKNRGQN